MTMIGLDGTETITDEEEQAYRDKNLKEVVVLSDAFLGLAEALSSTPGVAMNAFINCILILNAEHAKDRDRAEKVMKRTTAGMMEGWEKFWDDRQRQLKEAAAKEMPAPVTPASFI